MSALQSGRPAADRNAEATVHIAHLDDKVTDALLWELMVQAGPVHHVYIPRNRITGAHFGYGFCEFHTPLDALYATKVLNSVTLFSKPIRISQSTVDRVSQDVGANLFIGNLVEDVDEKTIHDAFSAFGPLIDAPYIMNSNSSRRYGFVKYGRFEHADAAIAAMNGQYICNHPISVQYAFKKDSHGKERHGSHAERVLASRALQSTNTHSIADKLQPNTYFADQPASKLKSAHSLPASVPGLAPQVPPVQQPHPHQQHRHYTHHGPPPPHRHHHPNANRPYHPPQYYPPTDGGWASNRGPPPSGPAHPNQMGPPMPHMNQQPLPPYQTYPTTPLAPQTNEQGWSNQNRRYPHQQPSKHPTQTG